jgi:CRP-like cAMP-binding protein
MWTEQHAAGDVVFRLGDVGRNFYVIRDGEVEILRDEDGETHRLNVLGAGDFFGEEALLKQKPRNATVRTTKPTVLYVLGEADFRDAISKSESLLQELNKVLFERQ